MRTLSKNLYYVECVLTVSLSLSILLRSHPGYDMNTYQMYGQGAGMGSYPQTASGYGPNRGYGAGGDMGRGEKDARGGAAKYHPYRRY